MQEKHAAFVRKLGPMLDPSTPHGGYVYSHSGHCASGGNVNGTSQARIADWYDQTGLFDTKHVDPPFGHWARRETETETETEPSLVGPSSASQLDS